MEPIINIKFGDKPVGSQTIRAAILPHMDVNNWTTPLSLEAMADGILSVMYPDGGFGAKFWAAMLDQGGKMDPRLALTWEIETFNAQLWAYRPAFARLGQHIKADGRPAIYEDQPTGEFDEATGDPITESVMVSPEIEALPATVEQQVWNEETEAFDTVTVDNPAIAKDVTERAAAQTVVDGTPQEVKDWAGS